MNKKIIWCKKQNKGLELAEPSDDVMRGYFTKAENAIKSMRNEADNPEWEITAAYYALYFSLYALLCKIGVKCEIHSCTVEFAKEFLNNYFSKDDFELLEKAKRLRQDIQYYIPKQENLNEIKNIVLKVLDFNLKCKEISNKIDIEEIKKRF